MIRKYGKFSTGDGRVEMKVLRWKQKKKIHIPVWRCWNLCLESLHEAEAEAAKQDHAFGFQILSDFRFTCNKSTFQNKSIILELSYKARKNFALNSVFLPVKINTTVANILRKRIVISNFDTIFSRFRNGFWLHTNPLTLVAAVVNHSTLQLAQEGRSAAWPAPSPLSELTDKDL